jgi:hypothetical protein
MAKWAIITDPTTQILRAVPSRSKTNKGKKMPKSINNGSVLKNSTKLEKRRLKNRLG